MGGGRSGGGHSLTHQGVTTSRVGGGGLDPPSDQDQALLCRPGHGGAGTTAAGLRCGNPTFVAIRWPGAGDIWMRFRLTGCFALGEILLRGFRDLIG